MRHAKPQINFTNKQKKEDTREYIACDPIYIHFKARRKTTALDVGIVVSFAVGRGERSGECVRGVLGG